MNIEICDNKNGKRISFEIIPFKFSDLKKLFIEYENTEFKIKRIYITIFNDDSEDIYITNENIYNFFTRTPTIKNIVEFITQIKNEYTINKFEIILNKYEIFYDDDALLSVFIKSDKYEELDFDKINKIFNIL